MRDTTLRLQRRRPGPQHGVRPERLGQVDHTLHAGRSYAHPAAVRAPPYVLGTMSSIARVEPLTTARALRGPFDYRIPREMEGVGVGSVLLVPFGRRRILGLVVDVGDHTEVPWEKLVEPVAPLEAGVPPELVELGLWVAEAYCSTPARGLALVLPPGTGTASHATPGASTRELLEATLTPAGREALTAPAARASGRSSTLRSAASRSGPSTAAELGVAHGTLASLERRGLVDDRQAARSRAARRASSGAEASRAADAAPRVLTPAQEAALARRARSAARAAPRVAAAARRDRAAARRRCTCAPPRRRSRRAARRS